MKNRFLLKAIPLVVGLLLTLFVTAGLFLSHGKELGERHAVVAHDADFDFSAGNFEDYIFYSKGLIQSARLDNPPQQVVDNLAPFILEPDAACPRTADGKYEKGIVLIHGLIDSPYSMKPFGEYLQSRCFYVLGLLLPDHGTRPGDFFDTHWADWAAATHFATEQLAAKAGKLFLSGHSAGGTLAILEAARNPDVSALILFAPALAISDAAKYARYLVMLGRIFPGAAWFEVEPDEAIYRYESFTFSAAAETYALIQTTRAVAIRTLQLPVFTVATMQDNTVVTPAILEYMNANTNPQSHTLLYSQHALPPDERIEVVASSAPEQQVLSVSHLGLMTPSSHPYYGRDGEYRSCGHYGNVTNPDFVRCKSGERDFYGETTEENLQQGLVERIAFNPFYDAMLEDISRFVDAVDD